MKRILVLLFALSACAGGNITRKRGALGGIPGGGFIPPTRVGGASGGGAGLTNGDYGDITLTGATPGTTWTVDSGAVAYSELSGAFSTSNVIPKGNGTTLTASSLSDGGAGTVTATNTKLDIVNGTQATERLRFSGQEFYQAANTSTEGPTLLLGVNRVTNRQIWLADSARLTQNTTNPVLQITTGGISALATDGVTSLPLVLEGSGVSIGVGSLGGITLGNAFNHVTATGNLSTDANLTSGNGAGDVFDHNGTLAKFGNTNDGATYVYENTLNAGWSQDTDGVGLALSYVGYQNSTTRFRNTEIYDGKAAIACTVTGSTKTLNCVGGLQVNGTSVVTTSNVSGTSGRMARFSGANTVGNSSMTDDAAGSVRLYKTPSIATLVVGDDTEGTTNTQSGMNLFAYTDGNIYVDTKTYTSGSTIFRTGQGTETGHGRTWLTVTSSSGNVATTGSWTLGDANTDTTRVNGQLGVNTAPTAGYEIHATPSGGGTNTDLLLQSSDGKNLVVSVVSGSTPVDITATNGFLFNGSATFANALTVDRGTSGAAASIAGTNIEIEGAAATNNYITFRTPDGQNSGLIFNDATGGAADGYVIYNNHATLGSRKVAIGSGALQRVAVMGTGRTLLGDTSETAVDDNTNTLQLGNTGTGQTTTATALIDASHSGSFNTTAGALEVYGLNVSSTATRSAGANALTSVAVRCTASGAQNNYCYYGTAGTLHNVGNIETDGNIGAAGASPTYGITNSGSTKLGDLVGGDGVGINTNPDGANHPLVFQANTGPKVALYPTSSTAAYGFGVQSSQLQYFVDVSSAYHSFGYGDSDAFTEAQRFDADGQAWFGDDTTFSNITDGADATVTIGVARAALLDSDIKGLVLNGGWLSPDVTSGSGDQTTDLRYLYIDASPTRDNCESCGATVIYGAYVDTNMVGVQAGTRTAYGAYLTATNGQTNYALWTEGGTVNFEGATVVDDTLDVTGGISNSTGSLALNDAVTVSSTLDVTGATTVTGALNGYTQITKGTDQDVTNAGVTADTALTFSSTSTKIYAIDAFLILSGNNATGDAAFRIAATAGTLDGRGECRTITTADAIQNVVIAAAAAAATNTVSVGTAADQGFPIMATCAIAVRQNTSSGSIRVEFGNAAASGGRTTRMLAGSYIRYKQLN